jgi:DNA topoisomerase-1
VRFHFQGKSGKYHEVEVSDPRVARIVRRCRDVPGYELFQYLDEDGEPQSIGSSDVNDYIRGIAGEAFTAKDFRTWAGTMLAAVALREMEAVDGVARRKKNIIQAIERVAERLGNTTAVCRKCYVHPAVLDAYLDGEALRVIRRRAARQLRQERHRLPPEEAAVLALLERRLAAAQRGDRLETLLRRSLKKGGRPASRPRAGSSPARPR